MWTSTAEASEASRRAGGLRRLPGGDECLCKQDSHPSPAGPRKRLHTKWVLKNGTVLLDTVEELRNLDVSLLACITTVYNNFMV